MVIVSRNAINEYSPVVIAVPLTDKGNKTKIYPSQVIIKAGEGGLSMDSVALGEQLRAISKTRLNKQIGRLAPHTLASISAALKIALDLP